MSLGLHEVPDELLGSLLAERPMASPERCAG